MMLLRRPSPADITRYLAAERSAPFSYTALFATRGAAPAGFAVDVYGTSLGEGEACFARAARALARFENYPRSFTRVVTDGDAEPHEGLVFVAHVEHLGFHSLNSCRVLYVLGDDARSRRYGFAFGTLTGHEEQGEERFTVSLDPDTGEVRYDVFAFSRPRGRLARLGAPIARALQRRFQKETCEAMRAIARG